MQALRKGLAGIGERYSGGVNSSRRESIPGPTGTDIVPKDLLDRPSVVAQIAERTLEGGGDTEGLYKQGRRGCAGYNNAKHVPTRSDAVVDTGSLARDG